VRITGLTSWREAVPLKRPYEIASIRVDVVDLIFVRISTDEGVEGIGSASPAADVTGETPEACRTALSVKQLRWLGGRDPRDLDRLVQELERSHRATPAARAAVDMALHDLAARIEGIPLVEKLGRCHDALPTSVTIGISSIEESIAEAEEYLEQGFRCLKVKTGRSLEEDVERLTKLRRQVGPEVAIRIDANEGYSVEETRGLGGLAGDLDLELIEQPLPGPSISELRSLPSDLRRLVAADESLHDEEDAGTLAEDPAACGIFNIKLMKCGGIRPALEIADIARNADIDLMWGCNDESVISIAAALHAAFACPRTRYLDLDGSFDLAWDPASGGFVVEDGCLRLLDKPGLGVELQG
jgi:L-alanine-DL-glutamate epimerase-like enolase superfamily enzyme